MYLIQRKLANDNWVQLPITYTCDEYLEAVATLKNKRHLYPLAEYRLIKFQVMDA